MQGEYIWETRIYHDMVDLCGVVYNSNYMTLMERARSEWLEHLGHAQDKMIEDNLIFVVRSAQLELTKPARYNQIVQVVSKVIKKGKASLVFEQIVRSKEDPSHIYCTGIIKMVAVDNNFKPCAIPKDML